MANKIQVCDRSSNSNRVENYSAVSIGKNESDIIHSKLEATYQQHDFHVCEIYLERWQLVSFPQRYIMHLCSCLHWVSLILH